MSKRFWNKVDKGKPFECWEWRASVFTSSGYGQYWHNGQTTTAHRASWMINRGPIPKGMFVLHVCDNRKCVNPAHLFVGTHQNNMDDMARKGRRANIGPKGIKNHAAKLAPKDVRVIRQMYDSGQKSQGELAKTFGVSQPQIGRIVRRECWDHI